MAFCRKKRSKNEGISSKGLIAVQSYNPLLLGNQMAQALLL